MSDVAIIRAVGGLVFDATFREAHTSEIEITESPVEDGSVIADHAYKLPEECVISAAVSDSPLAVSNNDQFASPNGRSKKAYELLQELQARRQPFDVQTGLKLYRNMLIKKISTTQDKDSANVLRFEATLRQVIIVGTQVVSYPPRAAGATNNQASQTKDKGEQQATELKEETPKEKNKSALYRAFVRPPTQPPGG